MIVSCQYSFLCRLQLVSRHVIEVQEIRFKKFGTELRRGWSPADFSQKVCKQGREDIIVKVNLQSPIPTSFYITVVN